MAIPPAVYVARSITASKDRILLPAVNARSIFAELLDYLSYYHIPEKITLEIL